MGSSDQHFRVFILLLALVAGTRAQYEDYNGELVGNASVILPPNRNYELKTAIQVPSNKTGSAVIITVTVSICQDDGSNCVESPLGTVDSSTVQVQCYNAAIDGAASFTSGRASNYQVMYISPNSLTYLIKNQTVPYFSCRIYTATAPVQIPVFDESYYTLIPMNPNIVKVDLEARLQEQPVEMIVDEQEAAINLFKQCCKPATACAQWKAVAAKVASTSPNATTNATASGNVTTANYYNLCQVPGNICNGNGSLVQLDLSGYNLTCPYPTSEIIRFKSLQYIYTGVRSNTTNNMTGNLNEIASAFASNLPFLKEWDVSYNTQITGQLDGLCQIAGLETIRLAFTGVNGALPECLFDEKSPLRHFYASATGISGELPTALASSSKIVIFQIAAAGLTGALPTSLAPSIVKFNVSSNNLSGSTLPAVSSSTVLTSFDVSHNNLGGEIPTSILQAPTLYTVDVRGNQFSSLAAGWTQDKEPITNANDSAIRLLMFGDNPLQSKFPVAAAYLGNILILDISKDGISGPLPEIKQGMFASLTMLFAANNKLSGSIPDSWQNTGIFGQSLDDSKIFDVTNNTLTGPIPEFMVSSAFFPPYLGLSGNSFSNACVEPYIQLELCTDPSKKPTTPRAPPGAYNNYTESTTDDGDDGLDGGAIAGIVLIVLAVAALGGLAYWKFVYKKRKERGPTQYLGRFERFEDEPGHYEEGNSLNSGHVEMTGGAGNASSAGRSGGGQGQYNKPNYFGEP